MAALKLFCNNPNLKNLKNFIEFYHLRITEKKDKNGNGLTLDEFFENNREVIFKQLSPKKLSEIAKEKGKKVEDLTSDDINKDIELPCPSYMFIEAKYVNYSLIAKHTNVQTQAINSAEYVDKVVKDDVELEKVFGNIAECFSYATYNKNGEKIISKDDSIKRYSPGCRVLGWFKTMYFSGKYYNSESSETDNVFDLKQNFIDLSPFIKSLNTSINANGGSFTISLPHIPLYNEYISGDRFFSTLEEVYKYINKEQYNKLFFNENKEQLSVRSEIGSLDYFEWLIQPQDLLFISFNDMRDLTDDNIANHDYDIIGLVDSVSVSKNANGTLSVDINGKDLMKLITDDASIFYPTGVYAGDKSIFDNTETTVSGGDTASAFKFKPEENQGRTIRQLTGLIDIFASEPNDFSIDFVLKTVISYLANMQITPDELFTSWGDKRTTFSMLKPKNQ